MDKNFFGKGGSSDPLVRLKIEGEKFKSQETKYIAKTLTPYYDEKFRFSPVLDNELALTVIVEVMYLYLYYCYILNIFTFM
jgi:hypothetical protein